MPTSNEDLDKTRENVEKLRKQVAEERAKHEAKSREVENDITAAQLNAEEVRLATELAVLKDSTKASNVKAGVAGPVAAAREQMKLAEAQQKASEELRKQDNKVSAPSGEAQNASAPEKTEG